MKFLNGLVAVKSGNLTLEDADAVVNAANSALLGGGGVDGALHRAGGSDILAACRRIRETEYPDGLPTGQAVATTAGRMRAKYVIHTVGPVWRGGTAGEDGLLADAYRNSLLLARKLSLTSIAFPAISTGIYGFPADRAAGIVAGVLRDFAGDCASLSDIRLVFFSKKAMDCFLQNSGL